MMKYHTQKTLTGQAGVNLIEKRVLQMGWVWNATNIDAGIDGYIEIRDPVTGRATNIILQVQSKALSSFTGETAEKLEYVCAEKDLEYWMSGNAPVILVVSRPDTDEAYWVSIKDHFRKAPARKDRRVVFKKALDKFDAAAREALQRIAMPRDRGIYLTPPPRTEQLYTNLLEVAEFPPDMYRAHTDHDGREIRRALGWGDGAPDEWIVKRNEVVSFQPLEGSTWDELIDAGTVDRFNTSEWAFADDADRENLFRELIFRSLRSKLRKLRVSYFREDDYFYFSATGDLKPRRVTYKSLKKTATRTVFQGFAAKDDPARMKFYRHAAFSGQFYRFNNVWYLAITPTYHFTFDGWKRLIWYESKLKGIKALERNPAVLGQVVMWAALLADNESPLFAPYHKSQLVFGGLVSNPIGAGLNDSWWLWNEEDDDMRKASSEVLELPLSSDVEGNREP
jgi:hypothetical protein